MKQVFVILIAVSLALAPIASAETVSNTGNGVASNNTATINQNNSTTVTQTNTATITNTFGVSSNTGGNNANRNTGGSISVSTGDSGVKATIHNIANENVARVDNCCAPSGATNVSNSGNGDSSKNTAQLNSTNTTQLNQYNVANIENAVLVESNTGHNNANRNTVSGPNAGVAVLTGDSFVGPITISNQANANAAQVGGPAGSSAGMGVTLGNVGNGVKTNNSATANYTNTTTVNQGNVADVANWVLIASNTGSNNANRNTGGDVMVDTGDSAIAVALATRVNANAAWVDNCGCVALNNASVMNKGNGDSAKSSAKINKNNATSVGQYNQSQVVNAGEFYTNTGHNNANRNTGPVSGLSDPSVSTGIGYTEVGASTTANQNLLNSGHVVMPVPPVTPPNSSNGGWWYWMGYGWQTAQ